MEFNYPKTQIFVFFCLFLIAYVESNPQCEDLHQLRMLECAREFSAKDLNTIRNGAGMHINYTGFAHELANGPNCSEVLQLALCIRPAVDCIKFGINEVDISIFRRTFQLTLVTCFDYSDRYGMDIKIGKDNVRDCLGRIGKLALSKCYNDAKDENANRVMCKHNFYGCLIDALNKYCSDLTVFERVAVCDAESVILNTMCSHSAYCAPVFLSCTYRNAVDLSVLLFAAVFFIGFVE